MAERKQYEEWIYNEKPSGVINETFKAKGRFEYRSSYANEENKTKSNVPGYARSYIEKAKISELYVDPSEYVDEKNIIYTDKEIEDFTTAVKTELLDKTTRNQPVRNIVLERYEKIKDRLSESEKPISLDRINPNNANMFKEIPASFEKNLSSHRYVTKVMRTFQPLMLKKYDKREIVNSEKFIEKAKMSGLFHVRDSDTSDHRGLVSYFTFVSPPDDELKAERSTGKIKSKLIDGEDLGQQMSDNMLTSTIEDIIRLVVVTEYQTNDIRKGKEQKVKLYNAFFKIY